MSDIKSENAQAEKKDRWKSQYGFSDEPRWYVVHTYSGYENKVMNDLVKTIEKNEELQSQILEVTVPVSETVDPKTGKVTSHKLFPGYVLVYMCMNDKTWSIVRNTRGVTGYVGPESKPVHLSDKEIRQLGLGGGQKKPSEAPVIVLDAKVGDMIEVIAGPYEGYTAPIKDINESKQRVIIDVELFGRATPVEINFADIEKVK